MTNQFDDDRLMGLFEALRSSVVWGVVLLGPDSDEPTKEEDDLLLESSGKIIIGEDGRVRVFSGSEEISPEFGGWTREELDVVTRAFNSLFQP
jgi:hypothetical protein